MIKNFCFRLFFSFLILFSALSVAYPQNLLLRSCTGVNPSIKASRVENTKEGDINLIPCSGRSVFVNGAPLSGLATVQSVSLSMPSIFTVSGSPVTTSGTLTASLASQTQRQVFAAPTGGNGAPLFRALDTADIGGGVFAPARLGTGTANSSTFLRGDGTWATVSAGTVTSVDLALPSIFTVSGNPVTNSGTLTATLNSQTQNFVFAAPHNADGVPTFRALRAIDVITGIFLPARLGTGTADATTFLRGDGTWSGLPGKRNLLIDVASVTEAQSGAVVTSSGNNSFTTALPVAPANGTTYTFFCAASTSCQINVIESGISIKDATGYFYYTTTSSYYTMSSNSSIVLIRSGSTWATIGKSGTVTVTL